MSKKLAIRESVIAQKIYEIRDKKVMLSGDLAELNDVETKVLNLTGEKESESLPRSIYV